jgi:CubicO group peptidase (beta-lactamase class C family)
MNTYFLKWVLTGVVGLLLLLSIEPLTAQNTTYTDPAKRFSAEVPADWTDESTTEYGAFSNAEGLRVNLLAVEADDVQAGILAGLTLVIPGFTAEPVQSSVIPAPNGIWTQNIYVMPDDTFTMAVGQVVDGVTYLILLRAPGEGVLQDSSEDFNTLLLGFTVGEKIDLTGVQAQKFTPDMLADLESYIRDLLEFYDVPGAAVAVVQDGEVIYAQGFGVRQMGTESAVTTDTLFMAGSIGKSMTTMMIGTLVDEGVLDWETLAADLLPDFSLSNQDVSAQIRVRDLVNNASGVITYGVPGFLVQQTPQQVLESLATTPMSALPGEEFNYSNLMFAAGGYAAASAVGAAYGDELYDTYASLMQERVFDAIGMANTTLNFDAAIAVEDHASPHHVDIVSRSTQLVPVDMERFVVPIAPAGAPWSNIGDMALYLTTELNRGAAPNGKQVVSEASLNETQKPGINVGGDIYYGMGWVIEEYNGIPLIWHNGGTLGFTSDLAFLPDANLGVVVLNNKGNAENFNQSVREYVFELGFGLQHHADQRYRTAQTAFLEYVEGMFGGIQFAQADEADVAEYVGEYAMGVSAVYEDGFVLVTDYGSIPLFAVEGTPGMFYTSSAFVLNFGPDDEGAMTLSVGVPNDPAQTILLNKVQ